MSCNEVKKLFARVSCKYPFTTSSIQDPIRVDWQGCWCCTEFSSCLSSWVLHRHSVILLFLNCLYTRSWLHELLFPLERHRCSFPREWWCHDSYPFFTNINLVSKAQNLKLCVLHVRQPMKQQVFTSNSSFSFETKLDGRFFDSSL